MQTDIRNISKEDIFPFPTRKEKSHQKSPEKQKTKKKKNQGPIVKKTKNEV